MAMGEDSLFTERHNQHPSFQNPLRTLSNILPSLVAPDDLLTHDTAWLCAPYPCGMCNTSFDSSETGRPLILFGHLKNGSFLIQSKILCTGSLNATFTLLICASSSFIRKSFLGFQGKMPCQVRFSNRALPLFCNRSSWRRLYYLMRLISCLISLGGLFANDSHSLESSGNPILKMLAVIFSLPQPISLYSS